MIRGLLLCCRVLLVLGLSAFLRCTIVWYLLMLHAFIVTMWWSHSHAHVCNLDHYRAMRTIHSADYDVARCVSCQYCVKMAKHIIKLFSLSGHHTILAFPYQTLWQYSDGDPLTGSLNAGGVWKKLRFSTSISLYLGSDKRYGTPAGTRMQSIEWCHFQWPWMIPNPHVMVTPLFDSEYLRNCTRYGHLWCNTNRDTHVCSWVSFRMTLSDGEIFSDTKHHASLRQLSLFSPTQ